MFDSNPIAIPAIPLPKSPKFINLTGKKFTRLTVLAFAGTRNKRGYWYCQCDCGAVKVIERGCFVSGQTQSCGCLHKERTSEVSAKHGMCTTSEYYSWAGMLTRCFNSKEKSFLRYGARGITVCDRWRYSFENFYADMGPKPTSEHTLDRIDNNGNYEPSNCRWATAKEQCRNRRSNVIIEFQGITACLTDHCKRLGLNVQTVSARIKYGWPLEKALTLPVRRW